MKILNHTHRISFFICFVFLLSAGCDRITKAPEVNIVFENDKAVALTIRGLAQDNIEALQVQLIQPSDRVAVLGSFDRSGDEIKFEPLVPLTHGLRYEIIIGDSVFAQVDIPRGDNANIPTLLSLYPTTDTLPENLLKVYLKFSEPMVEGTSLTHILVLKDGRDTMKGTFLDLQPELWNNDGTVLTLWLDPGRIKRDLIPNKELGTPLVKDNRYTLQILNSWKSKKGIALSTTHTKTFVATARDEHSPEISTWKIIAPRSKTNEPLEVQLYEPLDQYILAEGTFISDANNKKIEGFVQTSNRERTLKFIPEKPWSSGRYTLQFEGRLEDLAGNNLYRPFDRNLEEPKKPDEKREFFTKDFEIKE